MRVLPLGLAYWRDVTHPNRLCGEACELWTALVVRIVQKAGGGEAFTKMDLLREFPYTQEKLGELLGLPLDAPAPVPPCGSEMEQAYYLAHHPLLQRIASQFESDPEASDVPFVMKTVRCWRSIWSTMRTLSELCMQVWLRPVRSKAYSVEG
jgi:hypothetical protein